MVIHNRMGMGMVRVMVFLPRMIYQLGILTLLNQGMTYYQSNQVIYLGIPLVGQVDMGRRQGGFMGMHMVGPTVV